ncbi:MULTISPECIES: hypothetical protein [Xanthomonas]|uniref:Uncharacterized protein n=1 Tax=Xanthomonas manihotis TaxID=43353 RepID=A0A8I2BVY6_XANMN|nr:MULTISPECIES: hypothetical protein [Xanthomonas]KUF27582.1 hypothetical protein AO826_07540 [Xanthomonas phaseoli pv. manihotis]MBO9720119.1 hypothetical protein [Xanthomonas phaseoli pv. manihotis]MBO9757730.1 hypothetical protein [Xanthomonas phaseoli pv. manihotis]MBO9760648.1 hypothetical protein [Xanthomonas phaseoli pv. manihotis]MBO9765172.1 hypothetical protein [Xanthomonas phaseoli pv. manihotis]
MPLDTLEITTWAGKQWMQSLHENEQACLIAVRENGAALCVPQREAELVGLAPWATKAWR